MGSIGRKLRKNDAPPALNMFPKFDEVPISTYLIVLAKIRRPSTTPSARMSRSLSSSTMSAASLATSVAVSTEIPTSASCSATASFTPSPRKPTVRAELRAAALMIRDFCSGVTRAKIVVRRQRRGELVVVEPRRASEPVSVPSTAEADVARRPSPRRGRCRR